GFLLVKHEELEVIPLFTEELSFAVPLGHSFDGLNEVHLQELEHTQLILLPQNYVLRQLIDTYCTELGITLTPNLEMSTMDSLVKMDSKEVGVTNLHQTYLDSLQTKQISSVNLINYILHRSIDF